MSIQRLRPAPARFDGPHPLPYTSPSATSGLPPGHIMFQVDPDTAAVLPAERRGVPAPPSTPGAGLLSSNEAPPRPGGKLSTACRHGTEEF